MTTYFKNIAEGINTTLKGLKLTLKHLWQAQNRRIANDITKDNFYQTQNGIVTVQYPLESIPIPDNGRYRLHNEMDDCIVCDKCAKVCPVDCIEIEPIKAIEEVGKASDGSPIRLYAAKFDIDMAKCCYCGLCTTVCPTESLTMTKTFDYSEFDARNMLHNYGNISEETANEKRVLLEQFQKEKEALKVAKTAPVIPESAQPVIKPIFKPRSKPIIADSNISVAAEKTEVINAKPTFRPTIKPKNSDTEINDSEETTPGPIEPVAPKPAFRPNLKPKVTKPAEATIEETTSEPIEPVAPKLAFRPSLKPKVTKTAEATIEETTSEPIEPVAPKPAFHPSLKPKVTKPAEAMQEETTPEPIEPVKPKPAFRPSMKPKPKNED